MPDKSGYVKFEGVIPKSNKDPKKLAKTELSYLIEFSIPEIYSGKEAWIAKSLIQSPKIEDAIPAFISGKVKEWVLEKNFGLMKEEKDLTQKDLKDLLLADTKDNHVSKVEETVEVLKPFAENIPDPNTIELIKISMKLDKIISLLEEK